VNARSQSGADGVSPATLVATLVAPLRTAIAQPPPPPRRRPPNAAAKG
jgi:hypothetical protein